MTRPLLWFSRRENRFGILTLSVVVMLAVVPVIPYLPLAGYLFPVLGGLIPLAAMFAISDERRHMRLGLLLGVPAVFGAVWNGVDVDVSLGWIALLAPPVFYVYTVWVVGTRVFRARHVRADTLWGAACVYLMIGMTWWFFYVVMEVLMPGSFGGRMTGMPDPEAKFELLYYSFVTLTTLGYGDILPLTRPVQTLSILEAITGVLYMGIAIAKLVGAYAGQTIGDDGGEDGP